MRDLTEIRQQIDQIDPQKMFESMDAKSNGFIMPGWEPERLEKVKEMRKSRMKRWKSWMKAMIFNID